MASAGEASILGMAAPLERLACAGCHGADAEGGREGSRPAPALRLDRLAGRDAAYAAPTALAETLRSGIAPDGRTLSPTMPRFHFGPRAVTALHQWLAVVATDERRGFGPNAIHVKIRGGDELVEALRAELDRVLPNGLWGLPFRLTLAEEVAPPTKTAAVGGKRERTADAPCFVAIGGPVSGCPITLFPAGGLVGDEPPDIRGLWASLADQARALIRSTSGGAVLTDGTETAKRLARIVAAEIPRPARKGETGWRMVSPMEMRPIKAVSVLLLCSPEEIPRLLSQIDGRPALLAPRRTLEPWVRPLLDRGYAITLADPMPPSASPEASPNRIVTVAVAVLVSALRACGGDCTRTRLISAFDALTLHPAGWYALDYSRQGKTGTDQVTIEDLP
ncbi:c-type cytochrome [Jiella avicenniae]|uniref:Cytochrome c domain-containing protein n=1 Tax=Jiella avicenniae TaxID=2907202 RepID=A0A9X1P2Y6_9HYPH|nr:hypothetical protein [Jiella avicenniae]MCE7027732.1 hypothetical protein [Jiella avicenniae]MCE7028774.1 hypothetical protein [Jiella avicenniae]